MLKKSKIEGQKNRKAKCPWGQMRAALKFGLEDFALVNENESKEGKIDTKDNLPSPVLS